MREPIFDCAHRFCEDAAPAAGGEVPMWAVLALLVLLSLLVVSFLPQPKKDPPPPLEKAVDDVLKGFEDQALTWGDPEARTAFIQAREKVKGVIAKYDSTPKPS